MVVGHIRGTCTFLSQVGVQRRKVYPGSGPVELAADGDGLHLDRAILLLANSPLVGDDESKHLQIVPEIFSLLKQEISPLLQSPSWTQMGRQS